MACDRDVPRDGKPNQQSIFYLIVAAIYVIREKRSLTNEHTDTVPTIHPAIASLDSLLIYCFILRTLSTIILCSLYLVFIFLREGLVTRRVSDVLRDNGVMGEGSPIDLAGTPNGFHFRFPETRDRRRRRWHDASDPILQTIALLCLYTEIFRKLLICAHPVCLSV